MTEHWIVIGAGSAGCVIANRLSSDPGRTVTLLDDGPDLAPDAVPASISGSNFLAAIDEPGRTHEGLVASRRTGAAPTVYHRGRGIGGSSAVNAMVALRGSDSLYRSWGWTDTDEAFERVLLPMERPTDSEVGAVGRALLAADERAEVTLLTRRGNRRVTSAEAYLWPVLDRSNLTVRPDAPVDVVRLEGRRAIGVRLVGGEDIDADRVVVSAGAIHTPTILLRSGVETDGVGEGLQEHPSVALTLALKSDVWIDSCGLVLGSLLQAAIDDSLVQLVAMNHIGSAPEVSGLAVMMIGLMTPKGRGGAVTIDGDGSPVVDFAMLDDERDVQALAAGVRLALDVLARPPLTAVVDAVFIDEAGTPASALDDDEAIAAWVRTHCADYVHASSSCAMGRVVDDQGYVIGYRDLLVCDASIFPSIPDVNTHLPTTMAAERLSAAWLAADRLA